jgi:transaldolase
MDSGSLLVLNAPTDPAQLRVKIFADGADRDGIAELYAIPWIRGFTTNPTLMRQAGIDDYETFAREVLEVVPDRPISFEVFSDDGREMEEQARTISSWGENVYVKIPVTDTQGRPSADMARRLAASGVKLNVTALMTAEQVAMVADWLSDGPDSFVSLFAGRVADTGRDPVPIMSAALDALRPHPHLQLIWASPREVLNIIQADAIGCHVITVTHDLLRKLSNLGRDLDDFSLGTVKMFHDDGQAAGYSLRTAASTRS